MPSVTSLSPYTSLIGFVLGLPTLAATYYQAWRTRREAERAREGLIYSQNCVEFLLDDGTLVNVVPLQALHSLPKPEDIVLLPGEDFTIQSTSLARAFRVHRVEHIYARVEGKALLPLQPALPRSSPTSVTSTPEPCQGLKLLFQRVTDVGAAQQISTACYD